MRSISATSLTPSSKDSRRVRPSFSAVIRRAVTCAVNALVDATEISGPAWRYTPRPASRAIVEPTTLQRPDTSAPLRFDSLTAARVSAVSPDCDSAITQSSGPTIGLQ